MILLDHGSAELCVPDFVVAGFGVNWLPQFNKQLSGALTSHTGSTTDHSFVNTVVLPPDESPLATRLLPAENCVTHRHSWPLFPYQLHCS